MNTIPSTEIIARPPVNETLPPGHKWVTYSRPVRPNPRRKYAPRNPAFAYLFV